MKNKILMCVIVLLVVMTNISCDNNLESNNIGLDTISLLGHGTQERLAQSEGELYRDVCMRILNLHGDEGVYEFKFRVADA